MPTTIIYKTSRFCTTGGCVEVALMPDSVVAVRDSKDRNKPPYFFSLEDWRTFVAKVKQGEFDFFDPRLSSQTPG
jgi:hypothetical protein